MQVELDEGTRALFARYVPDEDLRELVHQTLGVLRFALDRALAHEDQPAKYPLPAGERPLERALFERISRLPRATRRVLVEGARERMEAGASLRARHYGVASAINPHASGSVEQALHRVALPAPLRAAATRARLRLMAPGETRPAPTGPEYCGPWDMEVLKLATRLTLGALSGWLELEGLWPRVTGLAFLVTTVGVDSLFALPPFLPPCFPRASASGLARA
jgi:hypothetical protein